MQCVQCVELSGVAESSQLCIQMAKQGIRCVQHWLNVSLRRCYDHRGEGSENWKGSPCLHRLFPGEANENRRRQGEYKEGQQDPGGVSLSQRRSSSGPYRAW